MVYDAVASASSSAVAWLKEHPAVGEAARRRIGNSGKAVPDAVLEEPARLLEMLKEAVVQAIQSDAPVGVADELLVSLRILSARIGRLEQDSYLKAELASLQGLRDRDEITTALRASAEKAPDERRRASIERMINVANAVSVSDAFEGVLFVLGPDDVSPVTPPVEPPPVEPPPVEPPPVEPPPVEPPPVEPGRVNFGGFPHGVSTDATDFGSQIGGAVGKEVGIAVGGTGAAEEGERLGRLFGPQFANQLGFGTGSPSAGGGGLFATLLGLVGGAVGSLLCGPGCAAAGAMMGNRFGALIDSAVAGDQPVDPTTAVACVLCGPQCTICVLAAEPGNGALLLLH